MRFISPLKVAMSKAKDFILNLNNYRNTHYRLLNNSKINYKAHMSEQINNACWFNKVLCVYTVWAKSKREFDLGNVACVHEKFFEDALVELGKLEDDNVKFIPVVIYRYAGIDKDNPRVEIDVMEFNRENVDRVCQMLYDIYNDFGGEGNG